MPSIVADFKKELIQQNSLGKSPSTIDSLLMGCFFDAGPLFSRVEQLIDIIIRLQPTRGRYQLDR